MAKANKTTNTSGKDGDNAGAANAGAVQTAVREGWVHHHLILAAAIFVIVVVAGGLVLSAILNNSESSTAQMRVQQAALSSNSTVGINQLKLLEAGGLGVPQLTVKYVGAATVTISVVRIRAPINVTFEKYYNQSRIAIDVTGLPLVGGNLSFVNVKNGADYYSCLGSGKNSAGAENYSCSQQPESSTLFNILNMSNASSSSQYGSLAIHFSQLNESSYGQMPCTETAGYFSYANYSGGSQVQREVPSQGNLTFETCVSDVYKLPLTVYADVSGVKSSSISFAVLNLHEVYLSTNSSAGMAALPAAPT